MPGTALNDRKNVFAIFSLWSSMPVTLIVSSMSVTTVTPSSGTSVADPRKRFGLAAVERDSKEITPSFASWLTSLFVSGISALK